MQIVFSALTLGCINTGKRETSLSSPDGHAVLAPSTAAAPTCVLVLAGVVAGIVITLAAPATSGLGITLRVPLPEKTQCC